MEEGSLLQEALQAVQQNRDNLRNRLIVDFFLLETTSSICHPASHFEKLISLCTRLNDLTTAKSDYRWFAGGDGPAYGMHVTSGIPHVRGFCDYGPSVQDEWTVISQIMKVPLGEKVAMKIWDMDDGQLLLIESALVLPSWIDDIGPVGCEHRCWVVNGTVTLIRPHSTGENTTLALQDALQCLTDERFLEKPEQVQDAIEKRLAWCSREVVTQRTALVLPRKVALLLHQLPSLLHSAVASFEQHAATPLPSRKRIDFEDLQWTTKTMGRTSYALLRNVQTPVWSSADCSPYPKSAEITRMKRLCQVESTPHLQAALQLGMRVVAGLEYALAHETSNTTSISAEERILQHWIVLASSVNNDDDGTWLRQAWMAGPNQSPIDLSPFLKCPIASVDLQFPFPKSFPRRSLSNVIAQLSKQEKITKLTCAIPGPHDVDSEEWMHLKGGEQELGDFLVSGMPEGNDTKPKQEGDAEQHDENDPNKALDKMLGDFETFVEQESDIKGVVTSSEDAYSNINDPIDIDVNLFFNLLHKVLVSTPEEISNLTTRDAMSDDPYFSKDDYNMTAAADDEENSIVAMMAAMDLELQSHSKINQPVSINNDPQQVSTDANVLSGLLESLDASEGAPGPVRNILSEMSQGTPL